MSCLSVPTAELVVDILEQVLTERCPLDRAYSAQFSGRQLSWQQKAGVTRVCGDILRRLNLFAFLAETTAESAHYACIKLLGAWHLFNGIEQPVLHKNQLLDPEIVQQHIAQAKQDPLLWHGCPVWLNKLAETIPNWPEEREALAQPAKRYIRVNLLKTGKEDLAETLQREGISSQQVEGVETALEITSEKDLFQTDAFKQGLFEQQDAGSQLVAAALDVRPGMRVIDACAGNGGKSLQLAAQMQGKGTLLAMDVEHWKLNNLKKRARRAGAGNIETRIIENNKTIKRRKASADRLLLDVPCSGTGVLKRKPGAKWHDSESRIKPLLEIQADILQRYSQLLKPGGVMVYATCSLLPQENEQQVEKFLANNPQFDLVASETISPANTGFDGFYWAKLVNRS